MWKAVLVCAALACGGALAPGCEGLKSEGSSLAETTEPGREQVSKDTQELVKTLQTRVEELQVEVKDLQKQVEGKKEQ